MTKKKYQGHLLIANPSNPHDELEQAVILIVTHTDDIGVGLQLNNPHVDLNLAKVADNVGIESLIDDPVFYGGNMSQNKIHVVHSLDWRGMTTVALTKELGITNDISVLSAIAEGEGPRFFRACSGYWLWENNRLDIQLDPRNNIPHEPHKWEILPANMENTLLMPPEDQWEKSLQAVTKRVVNIWF